MSSANASEEGHEVWEVRGEGVWRSGSVGHGMGQQENGAGRGASIVHEVVGVSVRKGGKDIKNGEAALFFFS